MASAAKKATPVEKKLMITYRKSAIGEPQDQRATLKALGLGKLNSVVVQSDSPSVRGMIFKIKHLVRVEEVEA